MGKQTNRKKSKVKIILLAPILSIFFIVGWCLYCIGQREPRKEKQPLKGINKTRPKQDSTEIIMIPKEEIIAN